MTNQQKMLHEGVVQEVSLQLADLPEFTQILFLKNQIGLIPPQQRQEILSLLPAGNEARISAELSAVVAEQAIRKQIVAAGGEFIGKEELIKLGKLADSAFVPEIPAKYSAAFFSAIHPIRGGQIASHVILGFDSDSKTWYCVEKSIVPGTLGLRGPDQDALLRNSDGTQIQVEGVSISSPKDHLPIQRIVDASIELLLRRRGDIEEMPFRGVWARTADTTWGFPPDWRVLIGMSAQLPAEGYKLGTQKYLKSSASSGHISSYQNTGLLAEWN